MTRRNQWLAGMAIVLTVAVGIAGVAAKSTAPAADPAMVKRLNDAMTPGEGQKKLDAMVGTFDVKIRTWVDPSKPPFESNGAAVISWVLGQRYIQTMLSGFVMGKPYDGIGYAGYDNVEKKYVACYMDSESTGMEWYTGTMAPDGKSGKLTATIADVITGAPTAVEMRLSLTSDGNHLTELWQADKGGKMTKVMELIYTRKKS
jgi:hypothetical protein